MKKLYIALLVGLTLIAAGCGGKNIGLTKTPYDDGGTVRTTSTYSNVDPKTARLMSKADMVTSLCDAANFRHNDNRIISSVKQSPLVIMPNAVTGSMEAVKLPDNYVNENITYDSKTPPFDMAGCMDKFLVAGWERVASEFLKFGVKVAKIGGMYAVADKALDKFGQGQTINNTGEGDVRVVENNGDNNTYTEAGGLPDESFGEIQLGGVDPTEEQTMEQACIAAGGEWVAEEQRCSDGNGGTIEL